MARLVLTSEIARPPGVVQSPEDFSPVNLNSSIPMRCLTNSEMNKWLAGQGMHHQPMSGGVPVAGEFPVPVERRSRLMLADYLADLLSKDGNKLLEILPGPQPQAQDGELISRFRSSQQETRPLIVAPGHLFKSGDRREFRSLLALLLGSESRWAFYIYSAPSHTTLLVHDQIDIWSVKKGVRNELARHFAPPQAA